MRADPMSALLDPLDVLQSIDVLPAADWQFERLPNGLTNRTFLVSGAGHRYVLRLDDLHTAKFGLDRRTELLIRQNAAAAGLGPPVVYADPVARILLSEYVAGEVWGEADLRDETKLRQLAIRIRDIHSLPPSGKRLDTVRAGNMYLNNLHDCPGLHAFGERCIALIRSIPDAEQVCCCHNDIVADNIVSRDKLLFLDWEYACDTDPLFELAALIGFHDFEQWQIEALFTAYVDGYDAVLFERLGEQIRLFDALQWLWYAVRQCTSPDVRLAVRLEALQQRIR